MAERNSLTAPRGTSLLPLEVTRGHLNNALIELALGTMVLKPELLQGFMGLVEESLVELVDGLQVTRVVFHNVKPVEPPPMSLRAGLPAPKH